MKFELDVLSGFVQCDGEFIQPRGPDAQPGPLVSPS